MTDAVQILNQAGIVDVKELVMGKKPPMDTNGHEWTRIGEAEAFDKEEGLIGLLVGSRISDLCRGLRRIGNQRGNALRGRE